MPAMSAGTHDDDPETWPCFRHPDRETALRCNSCERPVCVDCAVQGAVGIKCPECARTSRAARGAVPVHRMARGIVVAISVAAVLGAILTAVRIAFLGIILAYLAGIAIGEAARRASGGYRDPLLARAAAAAAAIGFLALPVARVVMAGGGGGTYLAWSAVAAGFAAYAAYQRAS